MRVYQFRHTGLQGHLYPKGGALGKKKILRPQALPSSALWKAQTAASTVLTQNSGLASALKIGQLLRAARGDREVVMNQTSALRMTFIDRLRAEPPVAAALAIFVGSTATIVGAWYFEFVLKLPPCPLCLEERLPYHVVIPLSLLMAIAALARAPRTLLAVGFTAIIVATLCGAALGTYHAGVEWHWWAGPTDCSGPITDLSAKGSILGQLNSIHVVRCDEAAWRLLGISLAGYNVLISLALAAIAGYGLLASRRSA